MSNTDLATAIANKKIAHNKEITSRLQDAKARIEDLIYIGGCEDGSFKLQSFLEDIDLAELEIDTVLNISKDEGFSNFIILDDSYHFMVDNDRLGFLAKINIPFSENFTYDESGHPSSFDVRMGVFHEFYVYGHSLAEIVEMVEKESLRCMGEDIERDKTKPTLKINIDEVN